MIPGFFYLPAPTKTGGTEMSTNDPMAALHQYLDARI